MDSKFGLTSRHFRGRLLRSRGLRLAIAAVFGAGVLSVGNVSPASAFGPTTGCALFSTNNPSNFGENVNIAFFARAASYPLGPLGFVTFFDGGVPLGLPSLLVTDGVTDHSTVSIDRSSLSTGTHTITAVLFPAPGSTPCPVTPSLVQVVKSAQSTTALASSVNPTVYGQSTTFTATVTKPGGGTPTGTVQFGIDGSPFGAAQNVNGIGVATISTAGLSVANHSVTASFTSDSPATLNSDATLAGGQQVNPAATTTTVGSSRNPAEVGVAVTFTANVTTNSPGAGTPSGAVRFRDNGADLGAPSLDPTGQAQLTTSTLSVGPRTITTVYEPANANFLTSSSSLTQTIERARSTLTYNGAVTGDYHDVVTASATLTRTDDGTPVATPEPVNLTVGTQTCNTTTNSVGLAQCTIRVEDPAGTTTATAAFAGDTNYQPSNTTTPFTVTREQTALTYTGDTVILNGNTLHASAVLTENDTTPYPVLAGRVVVLTLGTGTSAQTCTALTNANGIATCNISPVAQPLGPTAITANFAQDAYYLASSTTQAAIIYAFPTKGAFAISTSRSAIGSQVTFYGAQWTSANPLSSDAPPAFKGFITSPGTPPACGGSFSASPGNSGAPPANVPSYMGTIATSSITKSGSTITGDRTQIVVVRTDGYGSLGQGGTGTIVAVVC